MSRPHKRRRRLSALLLLLLALFAAGYFPQEPLRRLLENRLRGALGPDVSVGRLHVVPALLQADVEGLHARSRDLDLDATRVRVRFSYATLAGHGIALDRLELDAPVLRVRTATGATGAAPGVLPAVLIRDLQIRAGRLRLEASAGSLELNRLQAHGGLGAGALELNASSGALVGASRLELGPLAARVRTTPLLELQLERLHLQSGASSLQASGSLGSVAAPRLALELDAHVALAEAARLLERSDLSGAVDVHARLDGPVREAALDATAKGEGLTLAGWPVTSAELRVRRAAGAQAPIDAELAAAALDGRLSGHARLTGEMVDARVDASGVGTELLRRRLAPETGALPGRLDLQAHVRGPLSGWLTVTADAQPQVQTAGQNVAARVHVQGNVRRADRNVDLRFSLQATSLPAGDSALRGLTFDASGTAAGPDGSRLHASITGSADLSDAPNSAPVPFEGQLHADGRAWSVDAHAAPLGGRLSVSAAAQGSRFDPLSVEGRELQLAGLVDGGQGTLSLDAQASGPLDALDGTFTGAGTALATSGADVGALQLDGRIEHGRTTFELVLPDLKAHATGNTDAGHLRAKLRVDGLALERLAALRDARLVGKLGGSAEVDVPLDRPSQAHADVGISALELSQGVWKLAATAPLSLRLREGRLQLDETHFAGSGLELQAAATADLEAASVQATLKATADLAALPAQSEAKQQGRVRADLSVEGPWSRPRVEGTLASQGLVLTPPGFAPIPVDDVQATFHDRSLDVPALVARPAGGTATLEAHVPLAALLPSWRASATRVAPGESASLEVTFADVDGTRLKSATAPEESAQARSRLSGRLELHGGLASLGELTGRLSVPATTLQLGETTLSTSDLDLALDSGHLALAGVELETPNGHLSVHGNLDLGHRELTASARGAIELRALSPLLSEAALTGLADVDLEVRGPWDALRPSGTLEVADGSLRLRLLGQAITGLRTRLVFANDLLRVERAQGELGGGSLTATGQARIASGGLSDVDLRLVGKNVALRYPVGMRSRLDAELAFTGRTGAFSLAGGVDVLRAEYDIDQVLDSSLFAGATQATHSPLLRSIAVALDLRLTNPARVLSRRNGFENVLAGGRLRLLGDLEAPLPFGQLQLAQRGTLSLKATARGSDGKPRASERPFRIDSGELTYDGSWNAGLYVSASLVSPIRLRDEAERSACKSSRDDVSVTLKLSGTLALPETSFRSAAVSDDANVLSLVSTGRCGADLAASGQGLALQQLSLLSDRLTSGLRGGLGALGLDEVSIEPQLLAKDQTPGARFTFGKRVSPFSRVVYSTALNNPDDSYVRLDVGPWHTLAASAKRNGDGTREATFGQRFEFGGIRAAGARQDERVRLSDVRLSGELGAPERDVRKQLGLETGRRATEWGVLDRADAVRDWLRSQGYLEAEVAARLEGTVAQLHVRSGPRYTWRVAGAQAPNEFQRVMEAALFEDEALDRGRENLLRDLRRAGHLRAQVRARVEAKSDGRELVFEASAGPLVTLLPAEIRGAVVLSPGQLLKLAGGERSVAAEPEQAAEAWQRAYRERHHLAARVEGPRLLEVAGAVRVVAIVDEGPEARLVGVSFEGLGREETELRRAAGLHPPEPFDEQRVADATLRLRNHYLGLGFAKVRITPELRPAEADLALVFHVDEGPRLAIKDVRIQGAERTRSAILLGRTGLVPGRPLDPREVIAAERRLMSLGTLASARGDSDDEGVVTFHVRESARLLTGYELAYQTAEGATRGGLRGQADLELRNLMGRGLVLGGRYSRGEHDDEGRAFLNLPVRRGLFTLSGSRLSEDLESGTGTNTRVQRELQAQQTFELTRAWKLLLGYRFKRVTLAPGFPDPLDVAGFQPTVIRDTRDNQLDTRSGRFYSLNFEIATKELGSDFTFTRSLFQARVFSTHGAFTWAQGYQLGLGWGFGDPIRSTERFKAGGPNSIRGYALDGVGPRTFDGVPLGGEAVLVLNQELRYRHRTGLGAAVFYDAGNVFDRVPDFSLRLRHAVGVGARYASPVGLLRLDVGFPLARRTGERSYRLYFSLGQAF